MWSRVAAVCLFAFGATACSVLTDFGGYAGSPGAPDASNADGATRADASALDAATLDAAQLDAADGGGAADAGGAVDAASADGAASAKIVFVSSMTYGANFATVNGASSGISGADITCNQLASSVTKLSGLVFKAWMSETGALASSRLAPNEVPHVRTDGVVVAPSFAALISGGPLENAIDHDEKGAPCATTITAVWTGTTATGGLSATGDCIEWTTQSSAINASGGTFDAKDTWSSGSSLGCDGDAHIYCIQQ